MLTPPLVRTASQLAVPRAMVALMTSGSSRTNPRSTPSSPASRTRLNSE